MILNSMRFMWKYGRVAWGAHAEQPDERDEGQELLGDGPVD